MSARLRTIAMFSSVMLVLAVCSSSHVRAGGAPSIELKAGWDKWEPYQYEADLNGVPMFEGLDVQLLRLALKPMGYSVAHVQAAFDQQLEGVKTGVLDMASGMAYTDERAQYAHFSDPYRIETDVLVVPAGLAESLAGDTPAEVFRSIAANQQFRLGLVRGFHYGPEADAFIADPAHAGQLRYGATDGQNLEKLLDGRVDAFLADHLAAETLIFRADVGRDVEVHPVTIYSTDVRVMFSKATVDAAVVTAFNARLQQMKTEGEYSQIMRRFLMPLFLAITLKRPWFEALGFVGTIAFAISGVLLARKERYSIFGAFVLAALPAVGGGAMRDVIAERSPIGILRSAESLYLVLITVAVGAVFYKLYDAGRVATAQMPVARKNLRVAVSLNAVEVFDALGLAAFTVTGVVIAIEQQCEPLWLWGTLLAVMTGAGGGILRDVVRADPNSSSLKSGFYAEIAVIWGLFLSVFLAWEMARLDLAEVGVGVAITMIGTFVTRVLVVRYGIQGWNLGQRQPKAAIDVAAQS
jgi:polar amino acid transport system substrate-binding protein